MTKSPTAIDPHSAHEFVEALQRSGNTHDADLAASLVAEDVLLDDAGPDETVRGREALRELFAGVFRVIPDIAFERVGPLFFSEDGSTLGVRWKVTGTRPDGAAVDMHTVDFYRFEDGLVSEYTIVARDFNWLGGQL